MQLKVTFFHQYILETGNWAEQLIPPFLFPPLLASLRSKQMKEKPYKTGCLSLHDCRCPNPKKHKLHNQISIKKMVHMMPVRLVKPEYNFHNNLKSMFGYTLEGERVWDYTCMKVFQALHSLWRMAGQGMWECGISLCTQTPVAASTPLPLTETVLQKITETFFSISWL